MSLVSLKDIVDLFDRWDVWKRVRQTPERVDALESRLAALEAQLAARPKAEACALCGSDMRVTAEIPHPTFGRFGALERTMACASPTCGHVTNRRVDPPKS